jgi:hypothetical protein
MSRLRLDAVTMVDAELGQRLAVTTMTFIERENRSSRFKVEVMTRPLELIERRT